MTKTLKMTWFLFLMGAGLGNTFAQDHAAFPDLILDCAGSVEQKAVRVVVTVDVESESDDAILTYIEKGDGRSVSSVTGKLKFPDHSLVFEADTPTATFTLRYGGHLGTQSTFLTHDKRSGQRRSVLLTCHWFQYESIGVHN